MSEGKTKVAKAVSAKATVAAQNTAVSAMQAEDVPFAANAAGTEAARQMAETAIVQSRDAYERAKDAMEGAVETLEVSMDKAGVGMSEMNRKVIDIAQTNLNASFDLARSLADANDLAQVLEIQSAYARKQFETLAAQGEEVRSLAVKVSNETVEPFKVHIARTMKAFDTAH